MQVLPSALDWLAFMAVNGSLRHQMLRAAQRTLLPAAPDGAARAVLDALLVAANHTVGARQWLQHARAQQRHQARCLQQRRRLRQLAEAAATAAPAH